MTARRCEGTTAAGNRCRNPCQPGEMYCRTHGGEAEADREHKKLDVLHALEAKFSYGVACELAAVSHVTVKWWRDEDPDFAAACETARGIALDRIESSLADRAVGLDHEERTYVGARDPLGRPIVDENGDQVLHLQKLVTKTLYDTAAAKILLAGARAQYRHGYEAPVADRTIDPAERVLDAIQTDPELAEQMDELLAGLDE